MPESISKTMSFSKVQHNQFLQPSFWLQLEESGLKYSNCYQTDGLLPLGITLSVSPNTCKVGKLIGSVYKTSWGDERLLNPATKMAKLNLGWKSTT